MLFAPDPDEELELLDELDDELDDELLELDEVLDELLDELEDELEELDDDEELEDELDDEPLLVVPPQAVTKATLAQTARAAARRATGELVSGNMLTSAML